MLIISGVLQGSHPRTGHQAVISVDETNFRAEMKDYTDDVLEVWQLEELPYAHHAGYYLRTKDFMILLKDCDSCD